MDSPATNLQDRNLPGKIAGAAYGLVLGILFGGPVGMFLGFVGPSLLLFMVASVFVAGYTAYRILIDVPEAAARGLLRFVFPSGYSTPYQPTFSHLQASAARGDVTSAVAGYQEAIRLRPTDPEPRFQLAEVLMQDAKPAKAVWYLGQARRLTTSPSQELYATQRMIDLYLGPLDDRMRAKMELKRLIERFPESREADAARAVLSELTGA